MIVQTTNRVRVPYIDLAMQHARIKVDLVRSFERVIDSGQFILGEFVREFEERFAALCGTRHAVAVGNGTEALVLALRALEIGAGDEVITAPNSFIATATAIVLVGARPVFVDVDDDMSLDATKIEAALTRRTRAVLPVHLTGRPAAMAGVMEVAERRGLVVVEDAAQAVGASLGGRRVGSFGHASAFSLHPLKNLNACGDGGVVTTDDAVVDERLRVLRNLGLATRENCVVWSGNSRLDAVQAAMLLVKLEHLEKWTEGRRRNAAFYRGALASVDAVVCPSEQEGVEQVYHTFVIRADRRDELRTFLAAHGIETAIHYPRPIHLQDAAANLGYREGDFPCAEEQSRRILSLPIYPELTCDQLEHVANTIRRFYGR